jgi:hypothetical protein
MAAQPSFLGISATQPDLAPLISSDLDGHAFQAWPDVDYEKISIGLSDGAPTDNLPILQLARSRSGDGPAPSFKQDYYDRIHLIPTSISLGNLTSDQLFDVEVWNAYFVPQNLASITVYAGDGLALTPPIVAPTIYGALESRMHTLAAYLSGPPVIDASYTFDFPSEDPVLTVTGDRVASWPFQPDWSDPVVERLSWLTDILEAYNGTEQAIELRSIPRKAFSFSTTLFYDDRQHLDALLWDWQARLFLLPTYSDPGVLETAISIDDVDIYVETADMDYRVGGYVILQIDDIQTEAGKIAAVESWGVTVESGLRSVWPAGTTVWPASLARLKDTQAVDSFAPAMDKIALQFDLEDTANVTAVDSPTTYRGYPVLEELPNWRDDISFEYKRVLQRVDNQTGVISVNDTRTRPITVQEYLWTRIGRTAISSLRAWFHARKGRLNPIWVPTFRSDITLVEKVFSTQAIMKVKRFEYYRYLTQQNGRKDIVIWLHGNTRIYRRINTSSVIDAETEELVLSSTMGQDVEPSQVIMISFLQFSRLEADSVEFAWLNPRLLECKHMVRGLPDDV